MSRKIVLVKMTCLVFVFAILGSSPTFAQDGSGFIKIFDGKTLKNWDGNRKFWKVEDGTITGQTTKDNPLKSNTFIIWNGGKVKDFELKLEYRIVGGNSGIQYRSFRIPNQKWVIGGYQADFEAGDVWSGALYGERFRGILAKRGQRTNLVRRKNGKFKVEVTGSVGKSADIQAKIKKEDWNEYHIIVSDYSFIHKINGITTINSYDSDLKRRRSEGILALQLHAGAPMKVQFRNIRLKDLSPLKRLGVPLPMTASSTKGIGSSKTKKKRKK